MASRALGAFLALAAAAAIVVSIASSAWWAGTPIVDGKAFDAKYVHAGPLGAIGCNVGGDGSCEPITVDQQTQLIGYAALGSATLAVLFLFLLLSAALRVSEHRRGISTASLLFTLLAGGGAGALLALGPGIDSTQVIEVPIGWGTFVMGGGVLASMIASLITRRLEPEPLRLKPSLRQIPVREPREVQAPVSGVIGGAQPMPVPPPQEPPLIAPHPYAPERAQPERVPTPGAMPRMAPSTPALRKSPTPSELEAGSSPRIRAGVEGRDNAPNSDDGPSHEQGYNYGSSPRIRPPHEAPGSSNWMHEGARFGPGNDEPVNPFARTKPPSEPPPGLSPLPPGATLPAGSNAKLPGVGPGPIRAGGNLPGVSNLPGMPPATGSAPNLPGMPRPKPPSNSPLPGMTDRGSAQFGREPGTGPQNPFDRESGTGPGNPFDRETGTAFGGSGTGPQIPFGTSSPSSGTGPQIPFGTSGPRSSPPPTPGTGPQSPIRSSPPPTPGTGPQSPIRSSPPPTPGTGPQTPQRANSPSSPPSPGTGPQTPLRNSPGTGPQAPQRNTPPPPPSTGPQTPQRNTPLPGSLASRTNPPTSPPGAFSTPINRPSPGRSASPSSPPPTGPARPSSPSLPASPTASPPAARTSSPVGISTPPEKIGKTTEPGNAIPSTPLPRAKPSTVIPPVRSVVPAPGPRGKAIVVPEHLRAGTEPGTPPPSQPVERASQPRMSGIAPPPTQSKTIAHAVPPMPDVEGEPRGAQAEDDEEAMRPTNYVQAVDVPDSDAISIVSPGVPRRRADTDMRTGGNQIGENTAVGLMAAPPPPAILPGDDEEWNRAGSQSENTSQTQIPEELQGDSSQKTPIPTLNRTEQPKTPIPQLDAPRGRGTTKPPASTASTSLPPPKKLDESMPSGPTPACPQCESPMAWVEEHLRFYCRECRMYF